MAASATDVNRSRTTNANRSRTAADANSEVVQTERAEFVGRADRFRE